MVQGKHAGCTDLSAQTTQTPRSDGYETPAKHAVPRRHGRFSGAAHLLFQLRPGQRDDRGDDRIEDAVLVAAELIRGERGHRLEEERRCPLELPLRQAVDTLVDLRRLACGQARVHPGL